MMVSVQHGIAFLCVPKCASTSIEAALEPYADIRLAGHPSIKHLRAVDYRRYVLPVIRKAGGPDPETFCLMREPLEGVPKLDHAINAGLLLGYMSLRQGDRIGLYAFDSQVRMMAEPAAISL